MNDEERARIEQENAEVLARMRRQTRRSFFVAGVAALGGLSAWDWLMSRREEDRVPWPIRRVLAINEGLWRDYFSPGHTVPDLTGKVPLQDRVNSDIGMEDALDA